MTKYRKKPVVIKAEQWFSVIYLKEKRRSIRTESKYFLGVGYYRRPELDGRDKCKHCDIVMHNHGWIDTLEGGHIVCPEDWIIKGIKGEFYPCKPDIFKLTYEKLI